MRLPLRQIAVYGRLGRISNLPTVWTNTLTGVVLAGGSLQEAGLPALLAAFTLFYTGGMFLNDAFDRDIDRRQRPDRPIPSGLVQHDTVFAMGFGMLLFGIATVAAVGFEQGPRAVAYAVLLASAIILYDAHHKQNRYSPWIMGLCRALLYVTAAAAITGRAGLPVLAGAAVLFSYVVGLTYVAKRGSTAAVTVARGIAGISLLDGLLMAQRGAWTATGLAVAAFFLTRRWQRTVQGT